MISSKLFWPLIWTGVALLILLFFIILIVCIRKRKVRTLILVLGPQNVVCKRIQRKHEIKDIDDPIPPIGYKFDGWATEPVGFSKAELPLHLPKARNSKILYAKWINIKDNDVFTKLEQDEEECQEILEEKQTEHKQLIKAMKKEEKQYVQQSFKEDKAVAVLQKAVVAEEKARQELEIKAQIAEEAARIKEQALLTQAEQRQELMLMQEEVDSMRKEAVAIISAAKEDLSIRKEQIQQEKEELKNLLKGLREQLALQSVVQHRREGQTTIAKTEEQSNQAVRSNTKEAEIKGESFDDKQ